MKILALDTSTLTGSVALLEQSGSQMKLKAEVTLSVSAVHSERLMPAIERLLEDAGESVSAIDLYGVTQGPGSFTGIRIGIATAQGLALAYGKPVIGVSSLATLAGNGRFFPGLIVPMIDARRGEVYAGLYRHGEGSLIQVSEDQAISPENLVRQLNEKFPREPLLLLGSGALAYQDLWNHALQPRAQIAESILHEGRGGEVALLAWQRFEKGGAATSPRPVYLRGGT